MRSKQVTWHLYRYNPDLKKEGQNPFILDSKEPTESFRDFLMGEVRYAQLTTAFPDVAEELFELAEENAKSRYETYKKSGGISEDNFLRVSSSAVEGIFTLQTFKSKL